MSQCYLQSCEKPSEHGHHITYRPPVVVGLCRKHHEDITIVNGQQARRIKRKLTTKQRWAIWHQWLKGELKPRRTKKAMEYIRKWDRPRVSNEVVIRDAIRKLYCSNLGCSLCREWGRHTEVVLTFLAGKIKPQPSRCTGITYSEETP